MAGLADPHTAKTAPETTAASIVPTARPADPSARRPPEVTTPSRSALDDRSARRQLDVADPQAVLTSGSPATQVPRLRGRRANALVTAPMLLHWRGLDVAGAVGA
jgi:hypothetical protein